MLETIQYPETFSFESKGFSLFGRKSNVSGWYEFGTHVGGKEFESIGGEDCTICLCKLRSILLTKRGERLSEIKGAAFQELVGDNAEYIGYLVFSGYNTLYFFSRNNRLRHVVLADSTGKPLAISELQPELTPLWLTSLSKLGVE